MALRFRRGIDSDFNVNSTTKKTFAEGEPVFNTTTGALHIGRGDDSDPIILGGPRTEFTVVNIDDQTEFTSPTHNSNRPENVDVIINGIYMPPGSRGDFTGSSTGWDSVDATTIEIDSTANLVIDDEVYIRVWG